MTLTHIFKAQAVFFGIWVVIMWFVPSMMLEMHGWESSTAIEVLMQTMGAMMLAFAVIFWQMPTYAGDNLKKAGMLFGVGMNSLFVVVIGYHVATELVSLDPGTLPIIVFAALFFWKSRA